MLLAVAFCDPQAVGTNPYRASINASRNDVLPYDPAVMQKIQDSGLMG